MNTCMLKEEPIPLAIPLSTMVIYRPSQVAIEMNLSETCFLELLPGGSPGGTGTARDSSV